MEQLSRNDLKKLYMQKVSDYDKLLIRSDRVKDKLFEVIMNYNSERDKKKKTYFSNILFGICSGIVALIVGTCWGIGDLSFAESIAGSFMVILMSFDGVVVVSNIFADKLLDNNVGLNMDKQTINQLKNHLENLSKEKETLKDERDMAWIYYSKNIDNTDNIANESLTNYSLLSSNEYDGLRGKRRIRTIEEN